MGYQKIIIFLDNAPKNCVEINDDAHGTYKSSSQIKFKIQC